MNNPAMVRARQLAQAGRYAEALAEIARIEESGCLTVEVLLFKARILQLSDDDGPLEEVHGILKEAIQLDSSSSEAHLEMGWFLLNVQDDPGNARLSFQAALDARVGVNTEILTGLALSDALVLRKSEAAETIANLTRRLVDVQKLRKALEGRSGDLGATPE
jgi:hypothetical protein